MTTYFLRRQVLAATLSELASDPGRLVLRSVAVTLALLLPLIAATFTMRRMAGALASQFDDWVCAVAVLAFAAAALATRAELLIANSTSSRLQGRLMLFSPCVSCGLLLTTAWGRMPSGVALLAVAILVAEEAAVWWRLMRMSRHEGPELGSAPMSDQHHEAPRESLHEPVADEPPEQTPLSEFETPEPNEEDENDESLDLPPEATQKLLRGTIEGRDSLHGLARVAFLAQQTHASLHVAFCPPFVKAPHIDAAMIDGPDAQVTVTLVEPFGARLEARLARAPSAPASVIIEFVATLGE